MTRETIICIMVTNYRERMTRKHHGRTPANIEECCTQYADTLRANFDSEYYGE